MKKLTVIFIILFSIPLLINAQLVNQVHNLRTEYLKNPIGIDNQNPRLSWEYNSDTRGAKQTSYEITVCSDPFGANIVWNSGTVNSGQSVNINYSGPVLVASTRYYWKVSITNNSGDKINSTEIAFFETGLLGSGWGNAKWIRTTESATGIPMFRKKINIQKDIKSAKIYSSALGIYDLFVNGNRVGNLDGNGQMIYDEFKPGWTDYRKKVFYTTYDITTLLKTGENALATIVAPGWWKGAISHDIYKNFFGNSYLSFIAKILINYTDGSSETIISDTNWIASTTSPVISADIYYGETYDARLESNWKLAEFDDSSWLSALINNTYTGLIQSFIGPAIQVMPELELNPVSSTIYQGTVNNGQTFGTINIVNSFNGFIPFTLKKGQTVIFDLGQNMVGWVKFSVLGSAGVSTVVRFGEMLNDNGASSRGNDGPGGSIYTANYRTAKTTIKYTLKGNPDGESYKPSFTYSGFRYCEMTADDDIVVNSIKGEVVGSVTEGGSSFETSNNLVNKLYSNILWGQRGNFFSVVTDCPQRDERLGWTGDTQISTTAAYNADVASFYNKWLGDLRDSQRSDGAYSDVAPYIGWVTSFGTGAWAEVAIITPWTIYVMYNDKKIISDNFEAMEKYMNYLKTKAGGGYLYNGGGILYGDWLSSETTDKRYISVCYYAYAAILMSKMSKVLSNSAGDFYDLKQVEYNQLYNNIKTEFNVRYVNANGSLKQSTQTAYLFALKLGLLPNQAAIDNAVQFVRQSIINNGNKLKTGFLGTAILNQTLSEFGETDLPYTLLLQRNNPSWLYSIDQGATTVWERWDSYTLDKGFGDVNMNSFNHYSFSAISEWMYRYMAGIEWDENYPGYKHFTLQPNPDKRAILPDGQPSIDWINASFNSYYGEIKCKWERETNGKIFYSFKVPANTTATLYLPYDSESEYIYEGNVLAENAEGVSFVKKESGKAIYVLESGNYTFKLTNSFITSDISNEISINVYPNPVRSTLAINADNTFYSISDILGNDLLKSNENTVDISNFAKGIYFINIKGKTIKIIKN